MVLGSIRFRDTIFDPLDPGVWFLGLLGSGVRFLCPLVSGIRFFCPIGSKDTVLVAIWFGD